MSKVDHWHTPPRTREADPLRQGNRSRMRGCKLCRYSKVCNDLPGVCILLIYATIFVVVTALGYLFVTQELLQ